MEKQVGKEEIVLIKDDQILSILDLLNLYMCAYASHYISGNVLFGVVIFMVGSTVESYFRILEHKRAFNQRKLFTALFIVVSIALISGIAVLLLYINITKNSSSVFVLLTAILLVVRSMLTREMIIRFADKFGGCMYSMAIIQLILVAGLMLLLGLMVNWSFAFKMVMISMIYPIVVLIWLYLSRNKNITRKADYKAKKISSYSIYSLLLMCSTIALYLSIMSYTGMLILMPSESSIYLPTAIWVAIVLIITIVLGKLLKHQKKEYDKATLFILGGLLSVFALMQMNESLAFIDTSKAWIWSLLQAGGLAFMIIIAINMQEDIQLVFELENDINDDSIKTNRSIIQHISFVIAGALISVELYVMSLSVEGFLPYDITSKFMWLFNMLPMLFILLSMFFALLQPLNSDMVRKLKLYREQKSSQTVVPAFENRLRNLLVKKYRKRIGIKILTLILKPLCYHKIIGAKNVPLDDGPVIFIANHREIYGPIIVNLYLPFSFRPWIEHKMIERKEIEDYLWTNTFSKTKYKKLAHIAMNIVNPLAVWILNSVEPIPVYRGSVRQTIKTMKLTVTALMEQDNILIFPEDPTKSENGKYAQSGVSPFFTGFVHVAKFYYKQSKKAITFVPVYADPKKRTITFGEGVKFDPHNKDQEDVRVCELLMEQMNKIS